MRLGLALLLALLAASCQRPPPANPHYVLGQPYMAAGVWYYPSERFEGEETGLATVYAGRKPLTANGEVFDRTALTAAHRTLQLPAIVRLTNLENGLQVVVRINDRGPTSPNRVVEVTDRVATLLRFPTGAAVRVRLEVLPEESRAAVEAVPGAPKLDLVLAPRGEVQQADLPPPGGASAPAAARSPAPAAQAGPAAATAIARLPETVTQGTPQPGQLFIQLGTFQIYRYAMMQRTGVANLGATVVSAGSGRGQTHRVMIGPLSSVQQADNMLDQVLRSGVTDARIVVE